MIVITNKKYQPIKVFITEKDTATIAGKSSSRFNITKLTEHARDLEKAGLISIKEEK